jgi:hypothetical protein
VSAAEVSIGVAAVSAIAAAASAFASYRAVALSSLPFVTALWDPPKEVDGQFIFTVPLKNEGPGTALNVSCRVRIDVGNRSRPVSAWSDPPVYALSPGGSDSRELVAGGGKEDWFFETEFSDIRGAIWNVRRKSAQNIDRRIRRVRSGKLDFWRPDSKNTKAERRRPGLGAARPHR